MLRTLMGLYIYVILALAILGIIGILVLIGYLIATIR